MLSRISIGWQWLERTLNDIIDTVNENKPLQSSTIAIEETPNGTMLRVVDKKDQSQKGGQGGSQSKAASEFPSYAWVTLYDVTIKELTVVDPATCVQSTVTAYVRSTTGLDAVKFQAKIELVADKPANI